MLNPILEQRRSGDTESLMKVVSSRIAGGRKDVTMEPAKVKQLDNILVWRTK